MSDEQLRAKVQAAQDQLWSSLKDRGADVERIATNGPSSSADVRLMRAVMLAVAGMFRMPPE